MDAPRLSQLIESFLPIPTAPGVPAVGVWQDYLELLRTHVAPLRARLFQRKQIGWYSFLVHDRSSGVPTDPSDNGLYLHLRLSPKPRVPPTRLMANLPPVWKMTRRVQQPIPGTMDRIDVSHLKNQSVRHAWHLLGDGSEYVLRLLEAHDPKKRIPVDNVAQFLHYIGNELFVRAVGVPMP